MKKTIVLIISIFIFISSYGQTAADKYFKQGCIKDSLKDYKGAIADFAKAIKLKPNNANAYNKRGNVKVELKDYQGAIADYTMAIELDPNEELFYNNRADAKYKIRDYQGAAEDYTKAIELNPIEEETYFNRGAAKKKLKDFKGAISDFNEAIDLNHRNEIFFKSRAIAKFHLHDYKGAIADYNKAIKLQPDNIKWKPPTEGKFYFRASLPSIAVFGFNNGFNFSNHNAYLGLTIGLDYYYSNHSFLSFSGGATGISDATVQQMDSLTNDTSQFAFAFSAKLTNNHDLNFFSSKKIGLTVGYGLSYSYFDYYRSVEKTANSNDIIFYEKKLSNIGLCLDANIIFKKYWYIGLNVLPSLYTINDGKLEYSYLVYLDLGVRLPFRNNKKIEKMSPKF